MALEVADSEKSRLAILNKGDLVTYEGTIVDYGDLIAHRLNEGRIVDSKPMSPDERATWLANSSNAALQPIVGVTGETTKLHAHDGSPETIQEKADWVRQHGGFGNYPHTDAELAHYYNNISRAAGN